MGESALTGTRKSLRAGRAPAAVSSQTTASDDVMNVRMIEQLAGPGVEHADHAEAGPDEARVSSQLQ
jgi:hypothetical protein